jgi:5-(carboxyamino)imidazole ribonucleotide synthase
VIRPGATLGVLGGGQLGRMFTTRAQSMGYRVVVLDPDPSSPAGAVADRHIRASYDDTAALDELAATASAVTTEFENVPAASLRRLAERCLTAPPVEALATAQDRITEKAFLRDRGFATAPFGVVRTAGDIPGAVAAAGFPALLKTSRLGYDGKGQAAVGSGAETEQAFERMGGVACVLERRLTLEVELSVVLARGRDGHCTAFPVAENRHTGGILDTSVVPARVSTALAGQARQLAMDVAEAMHYVGVLGVELFVADGGRLFVNEMAPRPHNSGHYTIDACMPDQFEQQVRTLCDLPLTNPTLLSPVAMANLLGDLWDGGEPRWEEALRLSGVRLHLYGKATARPGRKMGHLNAVASTPDLALEKVLEARDSLRPT